MSRKINMAGANTRFDSCSHGFSPLSELERSHPVSSRYLDVLLTVLDDHHIGRESLLDDKPFTHLDLKRSDAEITFGDYADVLHRILWKTPTPPALGLQVGLRINLSDLDMVGYACLSSETWLVALRCFMKFQPLLRYGIRLRQSLRIEGRRAVLSFERMRHMDERTYRYLVDEWLGNWCNWLGSTRVRFATVRLTVSKLSGGKVYEDALGGNILLSQPADEIHLPLSSLERRLDMSNARVHALMVQQCSNSLACLERKDFLIERVKQEVAALSYHRVDSGRIADRLRISARTVRRNLAIGGTSFHDVVMEQRMSLAKRYLKDPGFPIKKISSSLGYSDLSSFYRAFRLYTGVTPGKFRGIHSS